MTEWDSSPEGKAYHRKAHQEWREKNREKSNEYHREYMKRWKESHPEGKDTHTMTKEEWLERYGYPMGDTTGWENWAGWDTRIRKGAEE